MTIHDPARAPRRRDHGYKGDAWSADTPAVGSKPVLLLDTGLDSVAILRMPNDAWDRSPAPTTVRAHLGYDETILIPRGSGTLYHGTDPGEIAASRFEAPATVVLPAGIWHSVAMDEGVVAEGTAFFTVPGTVVEPFAIQMEIVARGRVTFSELPVVHPEAVRAREWTGPGWPKVPTAPSVGTEDAAAGPPPADARILPYPEPRDGLTLPLDTGDDSLFIMSAASPAETPAPAADPVMLPLPDVVDVHRHPDVDEYIIRRDGAGFILNGRTQATVTLTPFRAPCVLVMPAGAFHRIVQTEDDQVGESILIYADRRAVVERYETIVAKTVTAAITGPITPRLEEERTGTLR